MTLSALLFTGLFRAPTVSAAAAASAAGCTTDDHGLTLTAMPDTGDARFQAIQFLSSNIGRAAGNGFMIGTSDGGCHWQSIYSGGKYSFSQMQFLTNSLGYVMAQTRPDQPNLLFRTADGGASFKQIHTGAYAFERVHFFSENVGFGFTRSFTFKTTNGGKSWTKVPTPPNTRYAHFVTVNKGWVIVVRPGSGYEIKRTIDGGHTWSNKLTVKSESAIGGAIYGTDSSDVWVVLLGGSGMSQTSYSLFHTKDGGVKWKQLVSNSTAGGGPAPGPAIEGLKGPFGYPEDMQVIGRQAAYLAASSGAYEKVSIGRSLDDGATFKVVSGVTGYGGKLSFTSPKRGWIAITSISYSAIYSTDDGGITWTKKFTIPEKK
jgi:photosystem II stability/assembly factor-like uncharacterized protein